jgi:hypothetical protein
MADNAPWTIKSVPIEVRQRAVKAAHAQGQTMAQWLTDAVNRLADQQERNEVLEPHKAPLQPLSPDGLAMLMQSVGTMAQGVAALAGVKRAPKAEIKRAVALVDEHVRMAMGQPPRPSRQFVGKPSGQTSDQIEQTTSLDGQTSVEQAPAPSLRRQIAGPSRPGSLAASTQPPQRRS